MSEKQEKQPDWVKIHWGLHRLKVTGGWLIRTVDGLAFIPDAEHENPPEVLQE